MNSNLIDRTLNNESFANEPEPAFPMLALTRIIPCEVLRNFSTSDPTGGARNVLSVKGSYVARIGKSLSPDENDYQGNILSTSRYTIGLPLEADVVPSDRIAVPGLIARWVAGKTYAVGDLVIPVTNKLGMRRYYRCTSAGASGATEPVWKSETSSLVTDGSCVWREAGEAIMFEVNGMIDQITGGHEMLLHVTEVL